MATRRTRKAKVETRSDGSKAYGPYKGSKRNNGRPVTVIKKKDGSTTSTSSARYEKEKTTGPLRKDQHVAHKSGTNKGGSKSTSPSATTVQSVKKNVGDGNKTRASRGSNQHRKRSR